MTRSPAHRQRLLRGLVASGLAALSALPALAQVPEPDTQPASPPLPLDDQSIAQLRAERDALLGRLTETLRRQLQLIESPGDRSQFLADLIRDPAAPVRTLGFSLALQELANARPLGPEPGQAAIPALKSTLADDRRLAGELLLALAPEGAPEILMDALVAEHDPAVARVLLRTASRWPTLRALGAIEQWATQPSAARDAAIDALAEAAKRNPVLSPTVRARVVQAIDDASSPPTPAHRIVQWLWGDEPTRDLVRAALADPAQRLAAVQALSCNADGTAVLLDAARESADLFPPAAAAAAIHAPTAATFTLIESLPAPSSDIRRSALLTHAANLSTDDLLAVARASSDRGMREALLARLTTAPVRTVTIPRRGVVYLGRDAGTIAGLLMLAQTRLDLSQPGSALQALDAVGSGAPQDVKELYLSLRTVCLAALDRVEDAAMIDAPPIAWVRALELVASQPQAPRVLALIESRFASELPDDLAVRVAAIRRKLGLFVGPDLDR